MQANFITGRNDEGITFGCEVNGKIVYFVPLHLIADEEIFTDSIGLSSEILDCSEDEILAVKGIFDGKRAMIQLYFNAARNQFGHPYPKFVLNMLLELDLSDTERAAVNTYLDQITFIYLIQDPSTGYVKIGRSRTPQERLAKLRKQDTLMPQPNNFHFIFYWEDYDYIEQVLHREYAEKRVRGEWFQLSAEDIQEIKNSYLRQFSNK